MHAYFDAQDGNPKVVIGIGGTARKPKKIVAALLDTGHTGSLSLPALDLINIGAKLSSIGEVEYGNGYTGTVYYFSVKVIIDGDEKIVETGMIENPKATEAVAGLELFAPYIAFIDFKNKKIELTTEGELKKKLKK